jgi:glycerol uptake facilitator-like aquaporin
MKRRLLAEFIGTAGLLIVVVGSGIMGETLAQGNAAIALLANSLATGAGLYALIQTFGHISGAHFNPAVSFTEMLWKRMTAKEFVGYSFVQVLGALIGVWVTHFMFGQEIIQLSTHDRSEFRFFVSEVIATTRRSQSQEVLRIHFQEFYGLECQVLLPHNLLELHWRFGLPESFRNKESATEGTITRRL